MTLHVCILGIDGSGKSTISAALPAILAAEMGLVRERQERRSVSPIPTRIISR